MRDLFDRRLTDPTADEVAAALVECVAVVNASKVGDLRPFDAVAAGQRLLEQPNGHTALVGGGPILLHTGDEVARLSVAWWTNPGGRLLVRVRGWREAVRRAEIGSPEHDTFQRIERDLAKRPPIWHLEPERVVEAFTAGDPEWVTVCGCGAAGSAESLGWHHGMCGPCADRVAEFGAEAVAHAPGLLATPLLEGTRDVVFSGDGRFVVEVGQYELRVWDAATGAPRCDLFNLEDDLVIRPVAEPGGALLFLSDEREASFVFNTSDGALDPPFSYDIAAQAAFWTGRPNELLVQATDNKLHRANVFDGHIRPVAPPPDRNARLCALYPHPQRPRAVFAHNYTATVTRVRDDGTLIEEWRFLLGNGRSLRTGMWSDGGPQIVRFSPDGERILFVRGTEIELRLPERAKALQQVEFPRPILDAHFSTDGEFVYLLTDEGIHVCRLAALSSVRARLRWHAEAPTRLAVSPDGRTLATAGPEGVKLWPVASLLPLLE